MGPPSYMRSIVDQNIVYVVHTCIYIYRAENVEFFLYTPLKHIKEWR